MMAIASQLRCSVNRIVYWMDKHEIKRRSISDAIYQKHNPLGDPFTVKVPMNIDEGILYGLGLGLYWGEGTKRNKYSVRLGNTDPDLIKCFLKFLVEMCGIRKEKLRFGLQIFTDVDPAEAKSFWVEKLEVNPSHFFKTTVTISGSIGTYRTKNQYGVLTVHYGNRKLRDVLVNSLPR